jgi:hypothetical protein
MNPFRKPVAPYIRPCDQRRRYRCEGGSQPVTYTVGRAPQAVVANFVFWVRLGKWTRADYETVTVVDTGEKVRVRTTYMKDDTYLGGYRLTASTEFDCPI